MSTRLWWIGPMIAAALGTALCAAAAGAQDQSPIAITQHRIALPGGGIDYTTEAGRTAIRDVATGATLGHTFYLAYSIAPARDTVPPITFLWNGGRPEEHTSELQSLMRLSYAVFCLNNKTQAKPPHHPYP